MKRKLGHRKKWIITETLFLLSFACINAKPESDLWSKPDGINGKSSSSNDWIPVIGKCLTCKPINTDLDVQATNHHQQQQQQQQQISKLLSPPLPNNFAFPALQPQSSGPSIPFHVPKQPRLLTYNNGAFQQQPPSYSLQQQYYPAAPPPPPPPPQAAVPKYYSQQDINSIVNVQQPIYHPDNGEYSGFIKSSNNNFLDAAAFYKPGLGSNYNIAPPPTAQQVFLPNPTFQIGGSYSFLQPHPAPQSPPVIKFQSQLSPKLEATTTAKSSSTQSKIKFPDQEVLPKKQSLQQSTDVTKKPLTYPGIPVSATFDYQLTKKPDSDYVPKKAVVPAVPTYPEIQLLYVPVETLQQKGRNVKLPNNNSQQSSFYSQPSASASVSTTTSPNTAFNYNQPEFRLPARQQYNSGYFGENKNNFYETPLLSPGLYPFAAAPSFIQQKFNVDSSTEKLTSFSENLFQTSPQQFASSSSGSSTTTSFSTAKPNVSNSSISSVSTTRSPEPYYESYTDSGNNFYTASSSSPVTEQPILAQSTKYRPIPAQNIQQLYTFSTSYNTLPFTMQTTTSGPAFRDFSPDPTTAYYEESNYPIPHQPPLSVYMEKNNYQRHSKINDILNILKDAKTIPVLDMVEESAVPAPPQVFVGPSELQPPKGYAKFDLPYLSSLDSNRVEKMLDNLPFFVAPLNFKPPSGYSKIPFPAPHIGSVVISNASGSVLKELINQEDSRHQQYTAAFSEATTSSPLLYSTSAEYHYYSTAPSLPTDDTQPSTTFKSSSYRSTTEYPKRTSQYRQRKPVHRGFSSSTEATVVTVPAANSGTSSSGNGPNANFPYEEYSGGNYYNFPSVSPDVSTVSSSSNIGDQGSYHQLFDSASSPSFSSGHRFQLHEQEFEEKYNSNIDATTNDSRSTVFQPTKYPATLTNTSTSSNDSSTVSELSDNYYNSPVFHQQSPDGFLSPSYFYSNGSNSEEGAASRDIPAPVTSQVNFQDVKPLSQFKPTTNIETADSRDPNENIYLHYQPWNTNSNQQQFYQSEPFADYSSSTEESTSVVSAISSTTSSSPFFGTSNALTAEDEVSVPEYIPTKTKQRNRYYSKYSTSSSTTESAVPDELSNDPYTPKSSANNFDALATKETASESTSSRTQESKYRRRRPVARVTSTTSTETPSSTKHRSRNRLSTSTAAPVSVSATDSIVRSRLRRPSTLPTTTTTEAAKETDPNHWNGGEYYAGGNNFAQSGPASNEITNSDENKFVVASVPSEDSTSQWNEPVTVRHQYYHDNEREPSQSVQQQSSSVNGEETAFNHLSSDKDTVVPSFENDDGKSNSVVAGKGYVKNPQTERHIAQVINERTNQNIENESSTNRSENEENASENEEVKPREQEIEKNNKVSPKDDLETTQKKYDPQNEKKVVPSRRRGTWVRRVRVKRPHDVFETAESQNLASVSDNSIKTVDLKTTTVSDKGLASLPIENQTRSNSDVEDGDLKSSASTETTIAPTFENDFVPVHRDFTDMLTDLLSNSKEQTDENVSTSNDNSGSSDNGLFVNYNERDNSSVVNGNNGDENNSEIEVVTDSFFIPHQSPNEYDEEKVTIVNPTTLAENNSEMKITTYVDETSVTPSKVIGTSTTTEISLETEICYRGKCVKSKKTKASDLLPTD